MKDKKKKKREEKGEFCSCKHLIFSNRRGGGSDFGSRDRWRGTQRRRLRHLTDTQKRKTKAKRNERSSRGEGKRREERREEKRRRLE